MRLYGYKAISSVGRRPLTDLKRLGHEGSMAGMHHMRVAGAIPPALQRNHSDEEELCAETGPLANLAESRCCEALAFLPAAAAAATTARQQQQLQQYHHWCLHLTL